MRGKSNPKKSGTGALEMQSIVARKTSSLHESNTTFSNQEQETPPQSNLDLSEEERYFSADNDTPESLEEISDSIDSSNKNNLDEHDDIISNQLFR